MIYLGWTLRLMLVIGMLPWGAFHGTGHRPLQQVPMQVASAGAAKLTAAEKIAETVGPTTLPAEIAMPKIKPKRCKTGVLLGSRCSLDMVLASEEATQPLPMRAFVRLVKPARHALLLPKAPPRRPPRLA